MSEPIVRTLASVASPQVCMPYDGVAGAHLFTATVSGAGSVSAAVAVEGSNDLIGWAPIVTLSPSGSGSAVTTASTSNSYRYVRANVSAVTGQLIVKMASETVEADTAVPPGMKPVYATPSATGMVISDGTKSGPVAGEAGGLTYDAAGRVATYQAFGVTWTLTYDASGRVASRTDGVTVQTAQYDSAGRFTGWV